MGPHAAAIEAASCRSLSYSALAFISSSSAFATAATTLAATTSCGEEDEDE